jgi:hypothetical protein
MKAPDPEAHPEDTLDNNEEFVHGARSSIPQGFLNFLDPRWQWIEQAGQSKISLQVDHQINWTVPPLPPPLITGFLFFITRHVAFLRRRVNNL